MRANTVGLIAVLSVFGGFTPALSAAGNPVVRYLPPDKEAPRSPLKLATLDFLLPGYGTYTQNQTLYAAVYFSANVLNLGLIYVAYRNWRFYESAYQAAAVRQAAEVDKLYFQDPTGGDSYLSLQDIKNRAERGQLFFALTITLNIVLRFFSAGHTWLLADEARLRAGPRYEFLPEERGGMRGAAGYQFFF